MVHGTRRLLQCNNNNNKNENIKEKCIENIFFHFKLLFIFFCFFKNLNKIKICNSKHNRYILYI